MVLLLPIIGLSSYVLQPFLIDGFKFDLRVYVLVTSCDPLRVFIHKMGLARFATEPYVEPSGKNIVLYYCPPYK